MRTAWDEVLDNNLGEKSFGKLLAKMDEALAPIKAKLKTKKAKYKYQIALQHLMEEAEEDVHEHVEAQIDKAFEKKTGLKAPKRTKTTHSHV